VTSAQCSNLAPPLIPLNLLREVFCKIGLAGLDRSLLFCQVPFFLFPVVICSSVLLPGEGFVDLVRRAWCSSSSFFSSETFFFISPERRPLPPSSLISHLPFVLTPLCAKIPDSLTFFLPSNRRSFECPPGTRKAVPGVGTSTTAPSKTMAALPLSATFLTLATTVLLCFFFLPGTVPVDVSLPFSLFSSCVDVVQSPPSFPSVLEPKSSL